MSKNNWTIAVDRGGTFTDIVAISQKGEIHTHKVLSRSKNYHNAIVFGIHEICASFSIENVARIHIGTTVATNALLERTGEKVCFVTTCGFKDILNIGYQDRKNLFALNVQKPDPIHLRSIGIKERIAANGRVITPIDIDDTTQKLRKIKNEGFTSLAIALMNSWCYSAHEQKVAEIAQEMGFTNVHASYHLCPLIKLVMRGQTTVINAYLHPKLKEHIDFLLANFHDTTLRFMQSSGGVTRADSFWGKDAILSGPAGGIVAVQNIMQNFPKQKAISFDMGGTSTDVSRFDGNINKIFETQIADIPFHSDMLNIKTIASGGGSILKFDGTKLSVGPESAGASPGPSCYGYGGPLTITDANLHLGRILPEYFPRVFGQSNSEPLQENAHLFTKLATQIKTDLGKSYSSHELAQGFIDIINQNMCNAIKEISIAEGFALDDYTLVSFGGAGGQHVCCIAQILGIKQIVVHPTASVFSAYGIAVSDHVETKAKSVLLPFNQKTCAIVDQHFSELEKQLSVRDEITRYLDLRVCGTDYSTTVLYIDNNYQKTYDDFVQKYQKNHQRQLAQNEQLEIVNVRIEASSRSNAFREKKHPVHTREVQRSSAATAHHQVFYQTSFIDVAVFLRSTLQPGDFLHGPAMIVDDHNTIFVTPEFKAVINEYNYLILQVQNVPQKAIKTEKDPVLLEVFNNAFTHIARQMGFDLINTAHSTNIKERLDFSCAIFDKQGNLVANAPHIPVHLGAMSETVKDLIHTHKQNLCPNDCYVSNDPFHGGSHLPDITVISPFFDGDEVQFFVACRGHHADIGGITPGSMPPFSQKIEEEGIVLRNFCLVSDGTTNFSQLTKILSQKPYPARNINERISDLQAQIAANRRGLRELDNLVTLYSLETVKLYTSYIQENACMATQKLIGYLLKDRSNALFSFRDYLENGACICVKITLSATNKGHAHIDFSGTSPQDSGNLNAPLAVVKSAILYVLRALIEEDIPLNSGCLKPLTITVPEKSILNPQPGAAVVGGNVETSQRIVDVLLGALQVVAASQGTMNNLTFGKDGEDGFGYYETICGGTGAGNNFHGANAIHSHMTNTRITDPEVLEFRYPQVRLESFSIRKNSGGKGKFNGGDGVIRRLRFLEACKVSILSERRSIPPYGLQGGSDGMCGKNTITNIDGREQTLPSKITLDIQQQEIISIYTPGGGGFGE
ncbi:hydantoinase B/oxoprolinase family protein [Candidatus Uabimicrobium amorphum]|uniref:5-oxoprolinase n=1 Tax=Uabimicrobium amorphum TaxID=2596890 RepID=A0A5S9IHW8_UABAM|nr:hydantoinase B/oxoprolinase family protein [Candidatus Uabimicrobium amorphum]BBM81887.1 5-oxoprolinase [Candidatus Uabimicrobium amorphum]